MRKLKPEHRVSYFVGRIIGLLMILYHSVPKRVTNWRMANEKDRRNDVA